MLLTEAAVSVVSRTSGVTQNVLVLELSSDNNMGWELEGVLKIKGISSSDMDEIEDKLARVFNGRCTLSVGPVEIADIIISDIGSKSLRKFCTAWGITPELLAKRASIALVTAKKALSGKHVIVDYIKKKLASTLNDIVYDPTLIEFLRHRRISCKYSVDNVAKRLGIPVEVVLGWEQGEYVPYEFRKELMIMYGVKGDVWNDFREKSILAKGGLIANKKDSYFDQDKEDDYYKRFSEIDIKEGGSNNDIDDDYEDIFEDELLDEDGDYGKTACESGSS